MSNTTHYENANFLRELAEYEDQVRAKVTAARADTRPGMTTEQLRQRLHGRYQELRDAV